METMKFIEFNAIIVKIMRTVIFLLQNQENHEILITPCLINGNHENLIIQCQNNQKHEIHRILRQNLENTRNLMKILQFLKIQRQNHEN